MENITEYLFIDLYFNNNIVNNYTIPKSTFTMDVNDLINLLTDYFNCMVNDLSYTKEPNSNNTWDSVTYYMLSGDIKSEVIYKTKPEMEQYSSYGEGILIVFNTITQP